MSDIDLEFTGDAEKAPPVQHCSVCGKPLSRYNNTGQYFHHPDIQKERRQTERENLRAKAISKADRDQLAAMAIDVNRQKLVELAEARTAEHEADNIRQELILDLVCLDFSVSREQIIAQGRRTEVAEARQVLMYLLYTDTGLSYPAIGELLGGRDHTTVIHGTGEIKEPQRWVRELVHLLQLYPFERQGMQESIHPRGQSHNIIDRTYRRSRF